MDRRVKERLVGASILAVLIVLVVPELLSGPVPVPATSRLPVNAPEPVRNVTVDLATSKAPEPPPALDAPAASTAAASSAGASGAATTTAANPSASAPPASSPPAATASAPVEIVQPTPTSLSTTAKAAIAGHTWAVQLGSFVSRENADKLARQLRAQGFGVYVLPGGSGSSLRYRVRIGPMPDRAAAAQSVAKLKSLGQVASLVPPGP
jgi:cell division septation protein DedD